MNFNVVPVVCVAPNPVAPKRDVEVPPKGLEFVLVVPNNPPLLVLVPNAVKQRKQNKYKKLFKQFLLWSSVAQ